MSSRAQQEQQAALGALAVFDDNQNGEIDRDRLRKILLGTGSGLASIQEVDIFMRLLPQGPSVSFQSIAEALTLPTQMHAISDAPSRRETYLALA